MKISIILILSLMLISFTSAQTVNIPPPQTNYSLVNVNNSQYLQSLTPQQVADLGTEPDYNANTYATGMNQGVATTDNPTFQSVTGTIAGVTGNQFILTGPSGNGPIVTQGANVYDFSLGSNRLSAYDVNIEKIYAKTTGGILDMLTTPVWTLDRGFQATNFTDGVGLWKAGSLTGMIDGTFSGQVKASSLNISGTSSFDNDNIVLGTNSLRFNSLATSAIVISAGSGLKIGTTTSGKLGFWDVVPIVQPVSSTAIDTLLTATGLRASGGTANFATNISTLGSLNVTGSIKSIGNINTNGNVNATNFTVGNKITLNSTGAIKTISIIEATGTGVGDFGSNVQSSLGRTVGGVWYPFYIKNPDGVSNYIDKDGYFSGYSATSGSADYATSAGSLSDPSYWSGDTSAGIQSGLGGTKTGNYNLNTTENISAHDVFATGNIGVGTKIPNMKLHVAGGLFINGTENGAAGKEGLTIRYNTATHRAELSSGAYASAAYGLDLKASDILFINNNNGLVWLNMTAQSNVIMVGNLTAKVGNFDRLNSSGTITTQNASAYSGYIVCYLASGSLGHCTGLVAIGGTCTCTPN